jgi:serine/threonine protein kinase
VPLKPGTRLGVYEILAIIGAGGMGEVYRARDTKLNRDVALKILPESFAGDPDRLARFRREAQVLASLNHPHIAHIYGLEDSDGTHALVLELVDGPTLADRVARGPLPIDETLAIARQIAEALEAAHEQGIIHRDLKPANIKVRDDGTVKVLDFGLAKMLEAPSSAGANPGLTNSPTITTPAMMTGVGMILGTAAYMSPEQAKGRPADKRSDVWAFGCVLYEMFTGRRAFEGEDVADTLAFVLTKEPDWTALPTGTPSAIRKLLGRCLQKDRTRRLTDVGVARLDIDETLNGATKESEAVGTSPNSRWRLAAPWIIAATLALVLVATVVALSPWKNRVSTRPMRLNVSLGIDASLVVDQGPAIALSSDGKLLAFAAQPAGGNDSQLYVRRLDQLSPSLLPGTAGARNPFFKPDGQWIGFFANGSLKKVSASGGSVVTLCEAPSGRGGSWTADDTITFLPVATASQGGIGGGLLRVSANGGQPEALTRVLPGELTQRWPQVLPGGKAVLYTVTSGDRLGIGGNAYDNADIVVQPLPPDGTRKIVQRGGYYGRYLASGHIAYLHEGTMFVAPFDLRRLAVTGPSAPALEGVMSSGGNGSAQFAVSDDGVLMYVPGQSVTNTRPISMVDRAGKITTVHGVPLLWNNPQFSPDGRLIALNLPSQDGSRSDVWIYDWQRDGLTPLTRQPYALRPVWTPNGHRIVFASRGVLTNLFWLPSDGTGMPERLTTSTNAQIPGSWHPSGRFFAFQETNPQTLADIMILPFEGDETSGWKPGRPVAFVNTPTREEWPAFSPDGRWIAFASYKSEQPEIYVRPFQHPGGETPVSIGGGLAPIWSQKRHELLYLRPDTRIGVVDYRAEGDTFVVEKPRVWASDVRIQGSAGGGGFDLHPDGDRIVGRLVPVEQVTDKRDRVVLISNFFDELQRIAPGTK